jgi:xylan 1,4-beta-xylosidase
MKKALLILCWSLFFTTTFAQQNAVNLQVDVTKTHGELKPIWAWFGYDEPNYTYMKDGQKLLTELAALSPVPVHVRAHNLMCTGDGTAALKWGSTNMYTEDAQGNPIYHWQIVDSIFDTYVQRGMKPLAQFGFMPEALSSKPQPYQHHWAPGVPYKEIITGWAYPPKDYGKWGELCYQWVRHCVDRYGKEEVESWYWELWNEPDGYYWMGTVPELYKLYDYTAVNVKRALPTARIGGPHSTGGASKYLRAFVNHCLNDTNAVTGKIGTPLDFVAFHAKGSPKVNDGVVKMSISRQLKDVNDNMATIASIPGAKKIPVIIGESDPEGCAACGMHTNPENAYRNGTMYSSYTAASIPRIYDLAEHYDVNLIGAVNWSFEFENQPWFYGFRDLATNGVDKPVLNVFRMLGMMRGNRVEVSGDQAYNYQSMRDQSVRGPKTDVNAFAAADAKSVSVLLWNYHDEDVQDAGSPVALTIKGIPAKKALLTHYRIDALHSNSYEVWKKMGSPQSPTFEQIQTLEKAGKLEMLEKPKIFKVKDGQMLINMQLPRQAVSFIKLTY